MIAIITPDSSPDSSTFIVALREGIKENKDFLYGGGIPSYSYYNGYILKPTVWDKINQRIFKFDLKTYLFEKYLIKQNIKTVIAEYGVTAATIINSCKKLNIKLISHFHGFDAYEHSILKQYKEKYKEVFAYSSSIIAVSKHMIKQLVELGADEQKIIYNPCAPNDIFYSVKPDYNSNVFISIGRFVDKKAPYFTILAFAEVLKKYPKMKLKMIGDGALLNTCINLTDYLGINNSVVFKGALSQNEVLEEIKTAFCYVQHSIIANNGDSEGTPVAVMEAAAAALPVISTLHAGIPDVHTYNKTALLSAEKDIKQMTANMIILIENRQKAEELGTNGRRYMKTNLSTKKYVQTITDLI